MPSAGASCFARCRRELFCGQQFCQARQRKSARRCRHQIGLSRAAVHQIRPRRTRRFNGIGRISPRVQRKASCHSPLRPARLRKNDSLRQTRCLSPEKTSSKAYTSRRLRFAAAAAIEQLKKLASQIDVPVFSIEGEKNPVRVAKDALHKAKTEGSTRLIVDTAGGLHIDEELMQQLDEIKAAVQPHEILFVASAATGQDAVKTAVEFDKHVQISGTILTMLDGSARAGAAISIREVTNKPLKFEGIGEKIGDLQPFNPHSMADRILGMGDVINLVRKAQENIDEEESKALEKKILKAAFTYDDYLKQMAMVKRMGSFKEPFKNAAGHVQSWRDGFRRERIQQDRSDDPLDDSCTKEWKKWNLSPAAAAALRKAAERRSTTSIEW